MTQIPFHLRYTLSRSQRLVPHLRIWGRGLTLFVVVMFLFLCIQSVACACSASGTGFAVFGGLAFVFFVLFRGLFVGLLNVLLISTLRMDVVVEEHVAGILIGSERWYLFLDGITDLRKFREDTWTIQHFNGSVVHVSVSAIRDDQIAHIRAEMERGRTPEGIQEVIKRGKRIAAIMEANYSETPPT